MEQVFIASSGKLRPRWQQAFPAARVLTQLSEATLLTGPPSQRILWLDLADSSATRRLASLREAVALGARVVAMSATPGEVEAFQALNEGARGYCHLDAAPGQLREIGLVVAHGGLWMLPELVRRLMALSQRVVPAPATAHPRLDSLTSREREVAEQVALGASNREIAAELSVTERTVKAHLSTIFAKLMIRDRVQLALVMNNIPALCAAS
ncbi:response regulator transcription factor [Kineobactrum salinum]|uniref:Response regulator transcription factor n=1 Tax=Kineobactrum salinum TaxID=2708301 RepID=A0A6C0U5R4_9GAMM|nr:response regulator transcription factor [Kineobactrum salinum]QIB64784.1 response regulator transcription factor [Kineobactrum salinum]